MSKLKEECGVFGIFSREKTDVAGPVYYGLYALQHRGQESCGIVVNDDGLFNTHKDVGLVNDVFTQRVMDRLGQGNMAIGHVRYATTGDSGRVNAQPIVVNHIKGRMALAHNGNLVNSQELRRDLELKGSIFHTTSDTEVISYIITKERLNAPSIEEAVNRAMDQLKGAYSMVIMSPRKLIAVRDEHGFRPLCFGQDMMGLDSYQAVLPVALSHHVPVIMDVDLGHLPPMMPLIVGSLADVTVSGNDIRIDMQLR